MHKNMCVCTYLSCCLGNNDKKKRILHMLNTCEVFFPSMFSPWLSESMDGHRAVGHGTQAVFLLLQSLVCNSYYWFSVFECWSFEGLVMLLRTLISYGMSQTICQHFRFFNFCFWVILLWHCSYKFWENKAWGEVGWILHSNWPKGRKTMPQGQITTAQEGTCQIRRGTRVGSLVLWVRPRLGHLLSISEFTVQILATWLPAQLSADTHPESRQVMIQSL